MLKEKKNPEEKFDAAEEDFEEEKIDFSSTNNNSELKPLVTLDSLLPAVKYDHDHDHDHAHDYELNVHGHVHNPDECDEC